MKATKNGWTVEGTPREIAELIGTVTACSLYETPEWNRIKHGTIYKTGKEALKDFERMHIAEAIRQEQAKIDKRLEECKEMERRQKDVRENEYSHKVWCPDGSKDLQCAECRAFVDWEDKYCHECGRILLSEG